MRTERSATLKAKKCGGLQHEKMLAGDNDNDDNNNNNNVKLTVAALAGSAAARCVVGHGARPVHRGHLPIGHRDLVGVGLVAVREEAGSRKQIFFYFFYF